MPIFDLSLLIALLCSWGYLFYTGSTFKVWRHKRRERRIHKLIMQSRTKKP